MRPGVGWGAGSSSTSAGRGRPPPAGPALVVVVVVVVVDQAQIGHGLFQDVLENLTTVSAAGGRPSVTSASDIETRVKHLDENRVQRQLLSYTVALGYDATLPIDELRPFYRTLNDDMAATLRKYPRRFLGVAAVPTTDPAWAARNWPGPTRIWG